MASPQVTDTELVESGEKHYRILRAKYGWRHNDADDIRQEILHALVRARERFDPDKAGWDHYSGITARSAVRDYFRRPRIGHTGWNRTRGENELLASVDELLVEPAEEHDFLERVETEELVDSLDDPRDRFVVLALLHGFSPPEISRMLGVTEGRASVIITRLRHRRMREWRKLATTG